MPQDNNTCRGVLRGGSDTLCIAIKQGVKCVSMTKLKSFFFFCKMKKISFSFDTNSLRTQAKLRITAYIEISIEHYCKNMISFMASQKRMILDCNVVVITNKQKSNSIEEKNDERKRKIRHRSSKYTCQHSQPLLIQVQSL